MKKIIILRGLPASGKSTYAKKLVKENPGVYKRINRDELRLMLDSYHYSSANEKFTKRTRDWLIKESLRDGKHVIVDDTNLSSKNFNRISQLAKEFQKESGHQVEVEIKEFEAELEECLQRDSKRDNPVGHQVIRRMHKQFYATDKKTEKIVYSPQDENLPPAIICDLDGTLAIMDGRSPYDGSKCEQDLLNQPVYDIVKNSFDLGWNIILLSGRIDLYKPNTERWLEKYNVPYHSLIMRKSKDSRKDSIIKKELFKENIEGKYFVKFILDDRNQVVDMWRKELNLPCLQVNYGDF